MARPTLTTHRKFRHLPTVSLRDGESLADYAIRLTRERDEARAEVDRLRALLRECLPLVEAQQLAAPPGDTLVARLTAALEE